MDFYQSSFFTNLSNFLSLFTAVSFQSAGKARHRGGTSFHLTVWRRSRVEGRHFVQGMIVGQALEEKLKGLGPEASREAILEAPF